MQGKYGHDSFMVHIVDSFSCVFFIKNISPRIQT
jgi:hypothetical protein